ncbi:MAG: hypothetical protein EOO77_07380 [Oxalobacteraceae bacterium]|nr:MAG: hypothetical protein EOO77_07380 [Oxalobacteraceae bacterium]
MSSTVMTDAIWQNALPPSAMNVLMQALGGSKAASRAVSFTRWIVGKGLWVRSRCGFHLVRGSNPNLPEGLKEDAFLVGLGFTAGKIRGAIKALLDAGILERLDGPNAKRSFNWRGQRRVPPVKYRFSTAFYGMLKGASPSPVRKESSKPVASSSSLFLSPIKDTILNGLRLSVGKLGKQPEPSKPVCSPSAPHEGLEAALAKLGGLVHRDHGTVPRPDPVHLRMSPETWPKVLDEFGVIRDEARHWLLTNIGPQGEQCYFDRSVFGRNPTDFGIQVVLVFADPNMATWFKMVFAGPR